MAAKIENNLVDRYCSNNNFFVPTPGNIYVITRSSIRVNCAI